MSNQNEQPQEQALAQRPAQPSQLFQTFGDNFGVNPGQVARLLANTVISVGKGEPAPTIEEVSACAIVCNMHNLNPFTKEIHCFRSKGKMLFAIGVDGWSKIAQRQSQMNGVEWESHLDKDGNFYAMSCKIYRRDWALPIIITEYLNECKRDTEPWNKSPRRMMRNRSFSQAIRMAFAISGLMDDTEADQITDGRFSTAILEGEKQNDKDSAEVKELAAKLRYNEAKMQTLRQQYAGREGDLAAFLRGEVAKLSPSPALIAPQRTRQQQKPAQQQRRQEPPPQQDISEDDTDMMTGSTTGGNAAETEDDEQPRSEPFEFALNQESLPSNKAPSNVEDF